MHTQHSLHDTNMLYTRVVVRVGTLETREAFFKCVSGLILGSLLFGSCLKLQELSETAAVHRSACWGFNITPELLVCAYTHKRICSHKTGIFKRSHRFWAKF